MMTKQFRIGLAIGLAASFLMPWVSIFGIGVSPFDLARSRFGDTWYFTVMPILAAIAIWVEWNDIHAKEWLFIAGLSPFVIVVGVMSQSGIFGSNQSPFTPQYGLGDILQFVGVGAFIAIACGVGLIYASFGSRR